MKKLEFESIIEIPAKATIITASSVAGGSASAGIGAGIGFVIGGTVGAGVGWLFGLTAGTISAAVATNRALTPKKSK